jgi:hypothetical protein
VNGKQATGQGQAPQERDPTSALRLASLQDDLGVLQPDDGCTVGCSFWGVVGVSGRLESTGGWGSTMLVVSSVFTAPGNMHGLFSLACVLIAFGSLASAVDAWSRLCSWMRSGGEDDFFSSFLPCTWALYCTQTHRKGQEASHPCSHIENQPPPNVAFTHIQLIESIILTF